MEINKSIKFSEVERKAMEELADSFQMIIDAMDTNGSIETERHFWEYDQLADVMNILGDFAENNIVFIR